MDIVEIIFCGQVVRRQTLPLLGIRYIRLAHSQTRLPTDLLGRAGYKRSTLLVVKHTSRAAECCVKGLQDGQQREEEERKCGPVNDLVACLVDEDSEECPGDSGCARSIAFLAGERVCGRGRLEEDECEQDKDLGPDAGFLSVRVDSEGFKTGDHDKNDGPSVVKREREVDQPLLCQTLSTGVVCLDNVVDLADRRGHQQAEDEREDVPVSSPEEDVDAVKESEKRESPVDAVDDDVITARGELEDHSAEQQEVDE